MSRSTYKLLQGKVQHCTSSRGNTPSSACSSNSSNTTSGEEAKDHAPYNPQQQQTTPSPYIIRTPQTTPATNDEQRRAAAAEARRKRRLVLTRRQNSMSPRRSTTPKRNGAMTIVPFAGLHDSKNVPLTPKAVATSRETTVPRCYPLIQPTIEGVESVATRWKNGFVVAIPTECTYEACLALRLPFRTNTQQSLDGALGDWVRHVQQLRDITTAPVQSLAQRHADDATPLQQVVKDPYCIVTPGCELKRHPILREVFCPRLYALRPSDIDKTAVMHRFNENMEVLERLASKLWPGPILIRLGLSSSNPWTRTPFVVEARPPTTIIDEENDPNNNYLDPPPFYKNFITLRCPRHPLAVKARKDVAANENCLLVSLPVHHSPQANTDPDATAFCTRARQVAARMAVLDGEDCREVFHVPTCEYGRPCESILWLDGRQRTVTVQSPSSEICNKQMVQAALRHFASKNTGNKKERMLAQAIISKWKVVSCATNGSQDN